MIFFALCGPFGHKNSGNQGNLTPKAIKVKKAAIRQNLSKLDFRRFNNSDYGDFLILVYLNKKWHTYKYHIGLF